MDHKSQGAYDLIVVTVDDDVVEKYEGIVFDELVEMLYLGYVPPEVEGKSLDLIDLRFWLFIDKVPGCHVCSYQELLDFVSLMVKARSIPIVGKLLSNYFI